MPEVQCGLADWASILCLYGRLYGLILRLVKVKHTELDASNDLSLNGRLFLLTLLRWLLAHYF